MLPELTDDARRLIELWEKRFQFADRHHKKFREAGERLYANYRSYKGFKSAHAEASPRDRDAVLRDGQKEWGAELFIPHTFATIETQAPRILSNRPRMLILPRGRASERNVENMKFTIDAQQADIDYELVLQDVCKAGLIYNLGCQKSYWRTDKRKVRKLVQRMVPDEYGPAGEWYLAEVDEEVFDGPTAENVDPFDFLWDPFASELDGAEYLIHRTWRSTEYVLKRMQQGVWAPLDAGNVEALSPNQKFLEVQRQRRTIEGRAVDPGEQSGLNNRHEVWECHDGDTVVTVLDGQWVLQNARNPLGYRGYPFQIYRPIKVPNSFVGIGAAEPIVDLQDEMNTLRRQRRDKATIAINMPFAFAEGFVNPDHFRFAPNVGIPVAGDPRELLYPLTTPDVPNSGYQEEARLAADIERATGLSDSLQGGQATAETATGAQLQVAAANIRIQLQTLRIEKEVAKPTCRSWVAMNQQKIRETKTMRGEQVDGGENGVPPRYKWWPIGPAELAGEFVIECEGGSTAPSNIPQDRQDAQFARNILGNDPNVDPRMVTRFVLEKLGVKQIDGWLRPDNTIPQEFLAVLEQAGVPGQLIMQTLQVAQQLDMEKRQAPPEMNGSAPADAVPEAQAA
jgi:hypothetical protein